MIKEYKHPTFLESNGKDTFFSSPEKELVIAQNSRNSFAHPNSINWAAMMNLISHNRSQARKSRGDDNMPNRLELYGSAIAIIATVVAGSWIVSNRIDDKVSESRVELNTTMQNNKTEIMTALQNNQTIILSRIDKLEDRSRDDSKTLNKIEMLLESKQDKK
ncbi:hypothetical protein [Serratia nematodiphila]|uniref:hypothetical protein n=1 Tax=Serratia nematodiphila TaxID=458197 RepID=UPI0011D450EF|nr:hypothetical protein [Serratia nematodiphila]TXE60098.1 hypothetical protein FOT58_17635 [Serratia nematodiphila]